MIRFKGLIAAATVALTALLAAPAQAQVTPTPVVEYATVGGFTVYNINMKVYATGFTVASMVRHDGTSLIMTDYMTAAQLAALTNGLDAASFTRLPAVVRTAHMIPDLPSHVVKYKGKTVTYQAMGATNAPVASATFVTAIGRFGTAFTRIADQPLFTRGVTGGIANATDSLTVSRSGHAIGNHGIGGGSHAIIHHDGYFDFATMNNLKALVAAANWASQPAVFAPNPAVSDAQHFVVGVEDDHDHAKTVKWDTGSRVPAKVTDVDQALAAAEATLP